VAKQMKSEVAKFLAARKVMHVGIGDTNQGHIL
jgi:hypothetical protein